MLDTTTRFLRKLSMFEACSDEELARLSDMCEHRRYRSGHEVVKQGARLDGLVLIRRGRCIVKQVVKSKSKDADSKQDQQMRQERRVSSGPTLVAETRRASPGSPPAAGGGYASPTFSSADK